MTRQAIQLGWLPRLRIAQTSEQGYGQIYVGVVDPGLSAAHQTGRRADRRRQTID
jgi:K+ transporter